MSRLSSEEAAAAVGNRYDLVLIAAARVRELRKGHKSKLAKPLADPTPSTIALTEIEQGLVGREYLNRVR